MKILIEESVLRQALEALLDERDFKPNDKCNKAITALRSALDAAEGVGPVCWMQSNHLTMFKQRHSGSSMAMVRCSDHKAMDDFQPLYAAPTPPTNTDSELREEAFKIPLYERNPPIIFHESPEIVLNRAEYNELREAARAVVENWDDYCDIDMDAVIDRLREALK